jgi:polyisoprenyl-phosphate glycosyltransferase
LNESEFQSMPKLSVVTPAYNEEDSLPEFYRQLREVLQRVDGMDYEIIIVDDGSIDRTREIIHDLHQDDGKLRGIYLSRNFGHQASIMAGLRYATGDVIAVMDSDLQDSPKALPLFLEKWHEGYDVVYAVRKEKEGIINQADAVLGVLYDT